MKMEIYLKEMNPLEATLEITNSKGKGFTLVIERTEYGHSHEDFTEWDITDKEYYFLEDRVDNYIEEMKMLGGDDL